MIWFGYQTGDANLRVHRRYEAAVGFKVENLTAKMACSRPTRRCSNWTMPGAAGEHARCRRRWLRVAMGTLVSGRLSVAAGCLGVIEDCLAEVDLHEERQQHGKPIAKHQLIQDHIAAIEIHRVTTDAIVMKAAEAKDEATANLDDKDAAKRADILGSGSIPANALGRATGRADFGGRADGSSAGRHRGRPRLPHLRGGRDPQAEDRGERTGKEYEAFK